MSARPLSRPVCAAALAGITLLAACSGGHARPVSAGRTTASPVTQSPSPTAGGTVGRKALAARYLAIAEAGNHRLEVDFDGLKKRDSGNLARARADLLDAAATERLFDRRLLAIGFPAPIEKIARALVWLNEARATLTAEAAGSRTLAQLHRSQVRLSAANRPVEQAVRLIRNKLGLPPPETS